ncbi:hypothetical protein [Isoptericola dokdonensis]|jgi:hypothetical protein|uniref:Uncharacterized protein n=1 Tax=Isoptericola dokdonensis DS-3 TaxID=1300344 RepID=A0A161I185_9MICO|nr:hypothetical protein [Isoptericola dokdonensis]ANC30955.1 hypothetical protein I598_1397 [Isoptericola dokdonensis DS-3]
MNTETVPAVRTGDHVLTDADRLRLARMLAASALPRSRTLCLAWIDVERRFSGVAVPVRDVPDRPGTDDAARFGMVIASVTERSVPYGSVVAVYVRPGGDAMTDADRAWNLALREQATTHGFHLHGLFVSGGGAVRPLTLDDAV